MHTSDSRDQSEPDAGAAGLEKGSTVLISNQFSPDAGPEPHLTGLGSLTDLGSYHGSDKSCVSWGALLPLSQQRQEEGAGLAEFL